MKEDGILVYSTCSLSKTQNEDVIQKLIDRLTSENSQFTPEIQDPWDKNFMGELNDDFKKSYGMRDGSIAGTIRFDPTSLSTSGMF